MEVDAIQSITEPWMCLPGEVNALGNCYNCQQPGHVRSQCTKARVTAPRVTTTVNPGTKLDGTKFTASVEKCYRCDKTGHFARECRGGPQPANRPYKEWNSKNCTYCKKMGHLIADCRAKKKSDGQGRVQEVNDEDFPEEN